MTTISWHCQVSDSSSTAIMANKKLSLVSKAVKRISLGAALMWTPSSQNSMNSATASPYWRSTIRRLWLIGTSRLWTKSWKLMRLCASTFNFYVRMFPFCILQSMLGSMLCRKTQMDSSPVLAHRIWLERMARRFRNKLRLEFYGLWERCWGTTYTWRQWLEYTTRFSFWARKLSWRISKSDKSS